MAIHVVYDDGIALSTGLVIYTLCIRKKGREISFPFLEMEMEMEHSPFLQNLSLGCLAFSHSLYVYVKFVCVSLLPCSCGYQLVHKQIFDIFEHLFV